MAHISRLKLKNFKSFKLADLPLPKTFVCFAGANGSGKSNLCDSIRFVLGETSLKSMRARKIKDLIHADSKSAEVTLYFDAGTAEKPEVHEIKRVIREDGKISYRLDGEKTTRSAIFEFTKKYNLDSSGRNTIAQGEVQRIINMNGKERRTIIDSVAGISDFEEKKKEAIGDLGTVENRIKEAHLVMGERKAFLADLEREREVALKYQGTTKKLSDAKGTLLKSETKRLEKELEIFLKDEQKLTEQIKTKEETAAELLGQMTGLDTERAKISGELSKKQNTQILIRKSEELKANLAANKIRVTEQEANFSKSKTDKDSLKKSIEDSQTVLKQIHLEIEKLQKELYKLEIELEKLPKKGENTKLLEKRAELERLGKELAGLENSLSASKAEENTNIKLIQAKNEELKSLQKTLPSDKLKSTNQKDAEIAELKIKVKALVDKIDEQFSLTKKLNVDMSDLDKKMLEVKEKASIYKVRSSPALANPALNFINELKKDRASGLGSGIHGVVADLISFDPKYAQAIEASAGSRLFYVVVDSVDTAAQIIDKLKKARAGRATFIPLDKIVSVKSHKLPNNRPILDYMTYEHSVERAISYVFAETILVNGLDDAKQIGIGQVRMVSLEGEIFERSGVMSGGRSEGSTMGATLIRKFEMELAELKSAKDSILSELYSIREHESTLRSEKSNLEIKIKTIELEDKINKERNKDFENVLERKAQLEKEISDCADSIENQQKIHNSIEKEIGSSKEKIQVSQKQLEDLESKIRLEEDDKDKRVVEVSSAISSLNATIEGKNREIELIKKETSEKQENFIQLEKEHSNSKKLIEQISSEISSQNKELVEVEKTINATGKEIEGLFSKMRSLEKEISEISKKSTTIKTEIDRYSKDLNQLNLRKVAISTHLEDVQTELSKMSTFEEIEFDKKELEQIISEGEKLIASLGNINMAAIEMYEKKKLEIDEVEQKITTLDQEREAILNMINQIEDQKKEIFNETFDIVSTNFSNMFKYINVGQGHLQLDKPAEPFNSGLFIKIRRNNKDYSLDALSGGEKTLVALMFIFALQFFKPSPFYILDEVDAALDKPNSKNLSDLVTKMAQDSQFILVSHNDIIMSNAETVIGVAKTEGSSKLVGINLKPVVA